MQIEDDVHKNLCSRLPAQPPVKGVHGATDDAADFSSWTVGRLLPLPSRLPTGWRIVRLTDVARLESGHTPSRRRLDYWGGDVPWVSLYDIGNLDQPEIAVTAERISKLGLDNSSARLLPAGTVIFSRTASVGKSTILAVPMATTQDFANYVCGPDVHNRYLMHLFRYMKNTWKQLMAGSIHNTIYMPIFLQLQVMLPPRREQEAIAATLDDENAQIAALEALLVKKRDVKQGAMQELLTGQRRLPGFHGDWRRTPLKQLGELKNGINKGSEAFGFGHPFVNLMDVFGRSSVPPREQLGLINTTPIDRTTYDLRIGDVLFIRSSVKPSGVGLTAVVEAELPDTVFSGFLLRFRDYGHLDIGFKKHAFYAEYFRQEVISRSTVSANTNVNQTALASIMLAVPPTLEEQTAIAAVLSDMDADIAALDAKLAKARDVKQGMMQTLLTGEIRLL